VATLSVVHGQEGFQWAKEFIFKMEKCGIFVLNPSAWGYLNPSQYCDVGRFFYGVFKF